MCTKPELFGSISWYGIWIAIGVLVCLFLVYDRLCVYRKISSSANSFYMTLGIVAIGIGFLAAGVVQATYNYFEAIKKNPNAKWEFGGITFMGGLYGGALTFVIGALIFAKGEVRAQFGRVCEIALACIPVAHGFGRIGCFAAGCCYGKVVNPGDPFAWMGVHMPQVDSNVNTLRYPVQLIEAIFLFILAAVMIVLVIKDKRVNSVVYFASYGVFRFLIEFLRDDDRGLLGSGALFPSQITSIISIVIAVIMLAFILSKKYYPKAANAVIHFLKLDVYSAFGKAPSPVEAVAGESSGAEETSAEASEETDGNEEAVLPEESDYPDGENGENGDEK